MSKIGQKFRSTRKSLGLTQLKFSKLLKIAQGYLSDLENGLKNPSDRLILSLEHLKHSQENESYKTKYVRLAEEHLAILKEVVALKEQLGSPKTSFPIVPKSIGRKP